MAAKQDGLSRDATDLLMGGVSAVFATAFTNPIEVVKTRLQLQGELGGRGGLYRGVPHGLWVVARTEGPRALLAGLPAMMGFQFFLNTFRLGVYRIAERRGLTTDAAGRTRAAAGAAAAAAGGALGSVAGAPFYLVKTRLQARAARSIAVGHQHAHASLAAALREIHAAEGVRGLFRGSWAQVGRGAAGSGAQMLAFTAAKNELRSRGVRHPLLLSFLSACIGGVFMTLCLNPFDVVATRLSNQPLSAGGRGALYAGAWDCAARTLRAEGAAGLYKGVGANYLRLGPHSVLLLVCWDQLAAWEARWRATD